MEKNRHGLEKPLGLTREVNLTTCVLNLVGIDLKFIRTSCCQVFMVTPFWIHKKAEKQDNGSKKDNETAGSNTTPPFPPGFTPKVRQQGQYDNGDPNVDKVVDTNASHCKSVESNTRIAKEVGNVEGNLYIDNRSCGFKLKEGGSILDILDEMIKVGQTMGFSMDGCTKDMEEIIGAQGENEFLLFGNKGTEYMKPLEQSWIKPHSIEVQNNQPKAVPDALDEYLQMGATTAHKCLQMFCKAITELYGEENLRKPTYTDMKKLYDYQEEKHGFSGMLRSIDCIDWPWKNCSVEFKAQFCRGRGITGQIHSFY
nr:hypothetical protein [Tanacetum cinerariifolium]